MRKPNTFIIGAPKCGTTSLSRWLAAHPDVFLSDPKEPQYFCRPTLRKEGITTERDYELLFAAAGPQKVVAEATSFYMVDETVLPKVLSYAPDARLLVMLRNPLEMVLSWHGECIRKLRIMYTTSFEEAWLAGGNISASKELHSDPLLADYFQVCALGSQLARVRKLVRPSQVHVAFLDDFKRAPLVAWLDVLQFLGLPDDGRRDFPHANVGYIPRRPRLHWFITNKLPRIRRRLRVRRHTGLATSLAALVSGRARPEELSTPLRRALLERFESEIRLLENLTGRDLSNWRDIFMAR